MCWFVWAKTSLMSSGIVNSESFLFLGITILMPEIKFLPIELNLNLTGIFSDISSFNDLAYSTACFAAA